MAKSLIVLWVAVAMTMADARWAVAKDASDPDHHRAVSVRLDNNAGVPEPILRFAKARTVDVFRRIGVTLAWLDAQDAIEDEIRPPYSVVLLAPQGEKKMAMTGGVEADIIGRAVPIARRAYVYYQRTVALVSLPDRDIVTLLGYVMAHELGHLMLPAQSHSAAGIMRANYDTDSRAIPTFTSVEADAIHKRLEDDERLPTVLPSRVERRRTHASQARARDTHR